MMKHLKICSFGLICVTQAFAQSGGAPTTFGSSASPAPTTEVPTEQVAASDEKSASTGVIRGVLFERGTKVPLSEVNVFILPHRLKTVTNDKGEFEIQGVPTGDFKWVVNASGYERLEQPDQFSESGAAFKTLFLEKTSYNVYETTIYGKAQKRDDSTKSLSAATVATLPGANGDPVKAVQNLPGVNRAAPFSSQVIIQGSAPQDTRYQVDSHEVPIIFHFGGFSSVVLPESLDRVDYLSAGYGPENGRAMGGLVGVWTRKPKTDRVHGFGFVDLLNSGLAIEGPVGDKNKKGSFLFGIRKSYIGEVLRIVAKDNDDFNLTAAPSYSDLTGIYDVDLTERDKFRLVAVGSLDTLEFVLKEPVDEDPEIRGNFSSQTSFFRIIPQLTHTHSERTVSRWSLGLGRDWIRADVGTNYFYLSTYSMTARAEVENKFTDSWTSYLGFDSRFTWYDVALDLPNVYFRGGVANPFSTGEDRRVSDQDQSHQMGAYWRNSFALSPKWTFQPGVRLDYFEVTDEVLPAPRAAVRYTVDESMFLRAAGGLYYQPPREQETAKDYGNPELVSPRAWHATVGAEKDFRGGSSRGFTLNGGPFYRHFDRLVIPSTDLITRDGTLVPEAYSNDGKGRAFGTEAILRYDFAPFTGWLSYTLARSTRWEPGQPQYVSQYDQTHNINLIGSVDLSRNWKLSSRFRYVSGNPYTPINSGIFDSNNDTFVPIRGPYFSERVDAFSQLDVRVDKKWIYDKFILAAYLDIQNITNRKNRESVRYSYDYRSRTDVTGLPFLPTLGIRGEF